MIFLISMLVVSLLVNIFFFLFDDIFSILRNRYPKKYFSEATKDKVYTDKVVKASLKMIKKRRTYMRMPEHTDFLKRLITLIVKHPYSRLARYFYPKGYLLAGLIKYGVKSNNKEIINAVEDAYAFYMDANGAPNFKLDKVDQIPFGLVAIELYRYSKDEKYKFFADKLYDYLCKATNKNSIILYNTSQSKAYVDTLGMICPFLMEYYNLFATEKALELAVSNMNFYVECGIDSKSHLPFHAIDLDSELRLGPTNWGRGITWYLLGLYYIVKYSTAEKNPYYEQHVSEFEAVHKTLQKEKGASLWPQFLGDKKGFDASASAAYAYVYNELDVDNAEDMLKVFKSKTALNGLIDFTSGDSIGINRYSSSMSYSEFSQGMLLFYLSTISK